MSFTNKPRLESYVYGMSRASFVMLTGVVVVAAWLALSGSAVAGKYYKWTDESGRVQFTDDISKVPVKQREKAANVFKSVKAPQEILAPSGKFVNGKKLWDSKCAECHHIGFDEKDGLRGLGHLIVNRTTRFPRSVEEVYDGIRPAIQGRTSIMDSIELDDEEIKAIAKYLIKAEFSQ